MMNSKVLAKFVFAVALALVVALVVVSVPVPMQAQLTTGDLVGRVFDKSGAVVPSATVEATNNSTGQKQTTTTNTSGEYRFSNLPAGHYLVKASGNGLNGTLQDVVINVSKISTANITASVGSASTTVEVVEQAANIDTSTSNITTTYETKQAQDLPTASVGLGVLNLSLLSAGVGTSGGIGAGTGPAVSGQRPRNNNFTIEGVDNNDKSVTGPLATVPNDAVENFTVLQNNFSPEFGHSSGGQFNTTIVSGTNHFHGRAYEYFQNRNLNGTDWQLVKADVAAGNKAKNSRFDNNRFGGQIGGPIIHDKLFFFSNWEYNPIGQASSGTTPCAPTAAGWATAAAVPGVSANNVAGIKQYATAGAPDAATCGTLTVGGAPIELGSLNVVGPNFNNTLTTANSVDFNPTTTDQVRFRYMYLKNTFFDTAGQIPDFWQSLPYKVHFGSLSEFHTFSPKITNELRIGFNRQQSFYDVGSQTFPGLSMFPNITIDELGLNVGPDPNSPQGGNNNTYQLADNVTWILGKHNLKFGMEARKYISPQFFTQRVRGDYEYAACNAACAAATGPDNAGNPFPTAANGLEAYLFDYAPGAFAERSIGNPQYAGDQYAIYGYGNDEFHITSHLTLNLGMRYEFTQVPAGWGLQALNQAASVPGVLSFNKPQAQKNNWAPRVGFAYSPGTSGNTSIRGGFAMAYDVLYDNLGLLSLPPQVSQTCDVGFPGGGCTYSNRGFLANKGLPEGSGVFTFATPADARAATSAYIPNQKLPYSESWNLGVQHIFAKKYIAEVRYVGTRGIHLPVQTRLNIRSRVDAAHFLPTYLTAPDAATVAGARLVLSCPQVPAPTPTDPNATVEQCPAGYSALDMVSNFVPALESAGFTSPITSFQPWGGSKYHGLQTQLTRNFTNGLQFQFAWTWSHMFDNSTADVFSTVLTPRRPQDFQNFQHDWSTSGLDHRHRFTAQVIYDLPFFKKADNWFSKNILGNWEIAPVYTFQSPEYATVQSAVDANLNGDNAGDRTILNKAGVPGTGSGVTAVTQVGGACPGCVVGYQAVNPNAYYIRAGSGALATAPRNTLRMDPINNWDLTAVKRFNITEGSAIEFQAQALNVFNHAQWIPGSINQINSLGYTSAGARNILIPTSPTFNNPRAVFSNNPRAMQLVLKFTF